MSGDDTLDTPSGDGRAQPRESWLERLKLVLGLRGPPSVRDDLTDALSEAGDALEFTALERTILKNVLGVRDVRVEDIMVPRVSVFALAEDAPLKSVIASFRTAGHSRLPVYGETLDDPKGMVHIRDLFAALFSEAENEPVALSRELATQLERPLKTFKIVRPVLYAPSGMPVVDLLVRMQAQRIHMALVIDEYGGTDGLISLEDIVETIVGQIDDEHDIEPALKAERDAEGHLVVDARVAVTLVSDTLGIDLTQEALEREVDSIGGLVTAIAGRVPAPGETIIGPGNVHFTVLDADRRRLKRIAVTAAGASDIPSSASGATSIDQVS